MQEGKYVPPDYGFEVVEATKDVGELGKLHRQLEEKQKLLEDAEEEVIKAKKAVNPPPRNIIGASASELCACICLCLFVCFRHMEDLWCD